MTKLCVICIYVTNMTVAKEFYCEKLGFEVLQQYDEATIELKHDSIPLVLCQVKQTATSKYPLQAQVVLGIGTGNILASMEELSAKGVALIYDTPQPCPAGLYNAFTDPFGNTIELLEFAN